MNLYHNTAKRGLKFKKNRRFLQTFTECFSLYRGRLTVRMVEVFFHHLASSDEEAGNEVD